MPPKFVPKNPPAPTPPPQAAPPAPDTLTIIAVPEQFDLYRLRRELGSHSAVGVHFQLALDTDSSLRVAAVALAWPTGASWVFHATAAYASVWRELMDSLLAATATAKTMHSIHSAAHALSDGAAYTVNGSIDLQLYYEHVVDPHVRDANLPRIANELAINPTAVSYKDALTQTTTTTARPIHGDGTWRPGQFPREMATAMAAKAQAYLACYEQGLLHKTSRIARQQLQMMTARRWKYASRDGGHAKIWFDTEHEYIPRSLECLGAEEAVAQAIPQLDLQCEIDSLLALLPSRYRDVITSIDGFATKLVDVCLDVGRVPHAYIGRSQRVVLDTQRSGSPMTFSRLTKLLTVSDSNEDTPGAVTASEVKAVLDKLGGELKIGSDNRAGIDRQLHRISVMRSKTDQIYGLTLRVGRTLYFASNFLLDLLMGAAHQHKSVLLLGRPGSGKTTLIRDIARCISESGVNVCIIDTSNEIGGDGLVPHGCVGWSRRMMVKSLDEQASVMVECVQNHTVETLIVDEIGRKPEVNAASTVRQRGPRIIASAHGDLRSLIKNKDLNGLVGGVQSVTVGDAEAKKNALLGKLQAKRGGNPIFDVVVEIDEVERGKCRIIWDVAQAVDDVLAGNPAFHSETRYQSFGMRGVQVIN